MSSLGNKMKTIALLLLLAPVHGLGASHAEEQCSKVKSAQVVRVDDSCYCRLERSLHWRI